LRTLFAVTLVLGVSAPTFTITTANSITPPGGVIAIDTAAVNLKDVTIPLGRVAVDGSDRNILSPVPANEPAAPPVAARVEEPEKADEAAVDDDGLPVTVPVEQVCEAVADAASEQGLPTGFLARLIWQESKFDQWARSHAGALGVAQFMPPTAAEFGLQDPFDPLRSVAASARFLRQLRDQFGNLGLAAAAYNAGAGRIRKWLLGQSEMPEETRNYVQIITGHPPKRWTVQKPLEISFALPKRAPCEGVEGLSRHTASAEHHVHLTGLAVDLIEQAEAARRAKIAAALAAKKKRYAAKASKAKRAVAAAAKPRVRLASAK
jgi:hypothetical protein